MAKQDMTLTELVAELELEKAAKADYVVSTGTMRMDAKGRLSDDQPTTITHKPVIILPGSKGGEYYPNEVFHQHMATNLSIPANYYRRMQLEAPELLAKNVNEWLARESIKKSLVRTFQFEDRNIARGMLSDRYGMMDNYDIFFAVLKAIRESGVQVEVKECNITDKRLYVNIVAPGIEVESVDALKGYLRDSQVGHGIVTGLSITNSEVGFGSFQIRPRAVIKKCMNGLIVKDDSFRKVHLGAKLDAGQINWSKNTQQKNLELIMSQTGDAIRQFLSEDYLKGIVQKLEDAAKVKLDQPVDALHNAVKEMAKSVTITEENKKDLLNYFVTDGDVSAAGIFHAATRVAQKMDADNRNDMETVAFEMLPKMKMFDKPFVTGRN
jgi:hypothetical protein